MPQSSRIIQTFRPYVVSGLAGAMLLLAGCASAPMAPTAALDEAKSAIRTAERDDAGRFASAELDEARQKLILADKAAVAENMMLAEWYANESTLTAQLAAARTESAKAESINQEMSRGMDALTEEMRRAGDQQ